MRGFQLYRAKIMQIFRKLTEQGKCVIFVSHSPDVASMCDEHYALTRLTKTRKHRYCRVI